MNVCQIPGCLDWSLRLPAFWLCGKSAGEMVLHSMGREKNHAGSSQAIHPAFLPWLRDCTTAACEGETRKAGSGQRGKHIKAAEIRTPVSSSHPRVPEVVSVLFSAPFSFSLFFSSANQEEEKRQ